MLFLECCFRFKHLLFVTSSILLMFEFSKLPNSDLQVIIFSLKYCWCLIFICHQNLMHTSSSLRLLHFCTFLHSFPCLNILNRQYVTIHDSTHWSKFWPQCPLASNARVKSLFPLFKPSWSLITMTSVPYSCHSLWKTCYSSSISKRLLQLIHHHLLNLLQWELIAMRAWSFWTN